MHNTAQTTSVSPFHYVPYLSHCSLAPQNSLSRLAAVFLLRSGDSRHCSQNATKLFRTSKRNATTTNALSKDSRLPYANKKPTQVSHNPLSLTCFEAECPVFAVRSIVEHRQVRAPQRIVAFTCSHCIPSQPSAGGHQVELAALSFTC